MKFTDRNGERKILEKFLGSKEGGLCCLYGRRRVGKSRLLTELAFRQSGIFYHMADRTEAPLQRRRLAMDLDRLVPGFSAVDYPDWGALFDRWLSDAPKNSALILDEFPYLVQNSPELPSILQRICDRLQEDSKKIIICGSSQKMMQGLVLDFSEPLYGRAREILKLGPLPYRYLKEAFPKWDSSERLLAYSIFGGIPRYWEFFVNYNDPIEAARELFFTQYGILRDEPWRLLSDNIKDTVQSSSILSAIGQGAGRLSEVAARLGISATSLTRPLHRLVDLDLVERETPFGTDSKTSKRSIYSICDQMLAFFYRFVLPNYSDRHYLGTSAEKKAFLEQMGPFLGLSFERLVRKAITEKNLPGISLRFPSCQRYWGPGLNRSPMEIDGLAESQDHSVLLAFESKLSLAPKEVPRVMAELEAKVKNLPMAASRKKVILKVFVAKSAPNGCIGLDWLEA